MTKTALITGVTGQDGAYLARLLLEKNYRVHGLRQPVAVPDLDRIQDIQNHIELHTGDLTDSGSIVRVIAGTKPDEVYHLGAQTHVHVSFDAPEHTANVNAIGTLRVLEALRTLGLTGTRFFQASTSELFGNASAPQNENTPFEPVSPYAAAKLYAYWMTRIARDAYGLHASNGIMFNHESPLRGENFVTRKITRHVARLLSGDPEPLRLGNLEAKRDWGHAEDMAEMIWRIVQHDTPGDYIVATGQSHSVRDFATIALTIAGFDPAWQGEGLNERAIDRKTGKILVVIDEVFFRPADVNHLCGDSSKAEKILGWKPRHDLRAIVSEMLAHDCAAQAPARIPLKKAYA